MREHDETTRRASRSSSRGERVIKSAQQTRDGVKKAISTYNEAEDRITHAGDAQLEALGIQESREREEQAVK